MLQEIVRKINEANISKELWVTTENFNKLLDAATKITLKQRGEGNKGHMLEIKVGDDTIGVKIKDGFSNKNGEYCYSQVIMFNEKRFPEYESAAVVL